MTSAPPYSTAIAPSALKPGDTIAFLSPSSRKNHLFRNRISRATSILSTHNLHILEIYHSPTATICSRVAEVHEAFANPAIKAIICTLGGDTVFQLLPHLDYSLIAQNPKIFCGYSDISHLHSAFLVKSGLRTFYGPSAIGSLGDFPAPLEYSIGCLLKTLMVASAGQPLGRFEPSTLTKRKWFSTDGEDTDSTKALVANPGWRWLRRGIEPVEGRLLGGCLPSIRKELGTEWAVDYAGAILVLETPEMAVHNPLDDLGEPGRPGLGYSFEKARDDVEMLRDGGVLEKIAGLVLGRPYFSTGVGVEAFGEMVLEMVGEWEWPVLSEVDVGHTDPISTVPFAALARLDGTRGVWEVLEPSVV